MTNETKFKLSIVPEGKDEMSIEFAVTVDSDVMRRTDPEDLWESVARLLTRHAVLALQGLRSR